MITVVIGSSRLRLEDVSEGWLTEQIVRRRRDGQTICVRVEIDSPGVKMSLSTPDCAGSGGSRLPTAAERRILELWDRMTLNTPLFPPENLIAFLKRVTEHL